MATSIRLKKSSVAGRAPTSSDLAYGELALNYSDGILYYKNSSNSVSSISGGGATTDSDAPSGGSVRDGNLWWDATNGRLKVYVDDGDPSSTPITVSMTVDGGATTNTYYEFSNAWTDRTGTKSTGLQDPDIVIQQGDTITITNSVNGVHPLFFVTALGLGDTYDSSYNVELPASNYGGGTGTVSYQFNSPGTYYYICSVHSDMIGTITVLDSGTASKQWVDAFQTGKGYTGSAGAVTQSDSAPVSPTGGQIWYDTATGKAFIWYIISGNGQWVLFSDPTVTDGDTGYTGSRGYSGSRGTISPRIINFLTPSSLDEVTVFYTPSQLTVSEVRGIIRGSTDITYTLNYGNRNAAGTVIATDTVTSTTIGDIAVISNSVIPANSWVWCEVTSVNGSINEFSLNLTFSE